METILINSEDLVKLEKEKILLILLKRSKTFTLSRVLNTVNRSTNVIKLNILYDITNMIL